MFSAAYRKEILTHYDNVGLRGLLYANKDDIFELPVTASGILSDMDYPQDYQRELALLKEQSEENIPFEDQAK